MKKITLIYLTLIILVLPLAAAFNMSTDSYDVDSFHQGTAGSNASTNSYELRATTTYEQPGDQNMTTTTYEANLGWFPIITFEVTTNVTEEEDETPDTPATPGGGGGGGTTTCSYEWVCTSWIPNPCPESGIQERVCVNKGTCTGTVGLPTQNQTCEYLEIEPLFDITLNIPIKQKAILAGDTIKANIKLINLGKVEKMDVYLKYWVIDENNKLILEKQDTLAIEQQLSYERQVTLPQDAHTGMYKLYAQITYDTDEKTAIASDTFWITKSKTLIFTIRTIVNMTYILLIILIIFIIHKMYHRIRESVREIKS